MVNLSSFNQHKLWLGWKGLQLCRRNKEKKCNWNSQEEKRTDYKDGIQQKTEERKLFLYKIERIEYHYCKISISRKYIKKQTSDGEL